MANEKKAPEKKGQEHQVHVKKDAPVGPSHCKFDNCKKSQDKFGFCMEHYELYMAGVIRGDGKKPIDYDQKLQQWLSKNPSKVRRAA